MGVYATAEEVADYLGEGFELPSTPEAVERLVADGEHDVDRALGPLPMLAAGRKLDPELLTPAQRGALARATAAAVEFRLAVDPDVLAGADDYLPGGELTIIRRAGRPPGPRVLEELSGYGLVKRSGTAPPDPRPNATA